MLIPVFYLGGDLTDGLEFQLPDLPFVGDVISFVPQVSRAPTTGPLIVRIKAAAGPAVSFIEAQVPVGALYGPPVSGVLFTDSVWVEVVSGGGAGYLVGYAVMATQGVSDLVPVPYPGLLLAGTLAPYLLTPGASSVDRFVPMVLGASPAAPLTLRLKKTQGATLPADYLESIIPAGAKQGPPSIGSLAVTGDAPLWLEVVGGNGTASWLYGIARVAPPAITTEVYAVPVAWPGQLSSSESITVRSPPFLSTLRYFRAGFQSGPPDTFDLAVDQFGGSLVLLRMADYSTFSSQTGTLVCPPNTLLRIRVLQASVPCDWLAGALYFDAPASLSGGMGLLGTFQVQSVLAVSDIELATNQWAGR